MKNLRERFHAMLEEMNKPNINIISMEADIPPISESEIDLIFGQIEYSLGYKLSSDIKESLFLSDEISLYWDYELDGIQENGGEFRLINLYNVFKYSEAKLWYDGMGEAEKSFYEKLRPFDDHPNIGDGVMGVFKLEHGVASPEIWLYDSNGICHRMDLDYDGYLECILDTKGFYGRQYLFCDIDLSDYYFKLVPSQLEKMLESMRRLFPETNYRKYFERYEKLTKGI